jgi:hypothetical protein
MAFGQNTKVHFTNLGGGVGNVGAVRYGWRATEDTYDDIASGLGVVVASDTDGGILFGANRPKPATVRINYVIDESGGDKKVGSALRFCEPDKLGSVLVGGALNGKKIKIRGTQRDINSVSLPSGR